MPIKAYNLVGLVERYHVLLRRAFEIISSELLENNITKEIRLLIATKAVNDTVGYNSIIPILLLFSIIPRITLANMLLLSTIKRGKAINTAISKVVKLKATRNLIDALYMRNRP